MLGLGQMGQTSENLARTRECVINLPSEDQVANVDRLAMTTGRAPVPELKRRWGYRHEGDKFGQAGLTAQPSDIVAPPCVRECPVQMEGIVHDARPFGKNVSANAFEVHIVRLHVHASLLVPGADPGRPHIDPGKWRPLLMSFCRFFGVGEEVHSSRLAESDFMKLVAGGGQVARTRESSPAWSARARGLAPEAPNRSTACREQRRPCGDPGRAR